MDTLRISELSLLYILCFHLTPINTAEFVSTIRFLEENTINISCRSTSKILIQNIDIHEEETICRDKTCVLNSNDKQTLEDNCNGYNSCLVDYNFTSTCLREVRYINFSYTCKHENGTEVSNFEKDFGGWTKPSSSDDFGWKRNNFREDHTRVDGDNQGYSIIVVSNSKTAGTARIHTNNEFMGSICLTLWYQFYLNCTDCIFNIYQTSNSKEKLIITINGTSTFYNKWFNISVDINGKGPFGIILEALFNNSKKVPVRAILIDDTSIAYRSCQGEQILSTCRDMRKPVRIECETQFIVGDIKLSLQPEHKTDCQEKAIQTDLNNVCRNKFNKSEHCYYSVFERMNKSEDCYDFTKNVSVKYMCVDIPDESLEPPVPNDVIGIAAGVSGGVILTIIVMVVICLKTRSKPGKQEASFSKDNKAFDELQNDDKSQQKINLSQSSSQSIITPTDTNLHKPEQLNRDGQESADLYNMSNEDGTYDVSGNERQRGNPNDNNIYSHTADNIYDSGSHHTLQDRNDETYDHFFGQQTEDEYDTTTRT